MKTKMLQQTVTFKASPRQTYDLLMDWKKHQLLSSQPAKISRRLAETSRPGARKSLDSTAVTSLLEALQMDRAVLNVGLWPKADMSVGASDVRFLG